MLCCAANSIVMLGSLPVFIHEGLGGPAGDVEPLMRMIMESSDRNKRCNGWFRARNC